MVLQSKMALFVIMMVSAHPEQVASSLSTFSSVAFQEKPHRRYLLDHHVELRVCVTVMAVMGGV